MANYTGFSLFHNDRKTSGSKQPDYKGNGTIPAALADYIRSLPEGEDVELDLVGWSKVGKSGVKFLSLAADIPWKIEKEMEENPQPRQQAKPAAKRQPSFADDDIPF